MPRQLNTRIQGKKDTVANWETNNPVLLNGELITVVTEDNNLRFKIGDGVSNYTTLPFQDEWLVTQINTKLTQPTGTTGQVLGFIADNEVGAIDAPTSSSASPYNTQFNGILTTGDWTMENSSYYQRFDLAAMTSTQYPLVFPNWGTDIANEKIAWNTITSVQTFDGYVRFYAPAPTTVDVNFALFYTTYDSSSVTLVKDNTETNSTFTPA